MYSKFLKYHFIFNLLLFISFSVAVNSFAEIEFINILLYIFFHLIFIYYLFYHYSLFLYLIGFFYGLMFDIILLNSIGAHLISFLLLISIYIFLKKYLFLLTPNQITFTIFITLYAILFFEIIFTFFYNNINFSFSHLLKYLIIGAIIFIPSIQILNRINN